MELENEAEREVQRVGKIISAVKVVKDDGNEILEIARSYAEDAEGFFEKKQFLQAFEAAVISWTYLDVGIHMKIFEVPEEFKRQFTV